MTKVLVTSRYTFRKVRAETKRRTKASDKLKAFIAKAKASLSASA